jgi:hypothetical protein
VASRRRKQAEIEYEILKRFFFEKKTEYFVRNTHIVLQLNPTYDTWGKRCRKKKKKKEELYWLAPYIHSSPLIFWNQVDKLLERSFCFTGSSLHSRSHTAQQ